MVARRALVRVGGRIVQLPTGDSLDGTGLPVGSIQPWNATNRAGIPAGWIARDGQLLNRADFPDLWALYAPFAVTDAVWLAVPYLSRGLPSSGNGTTTFRMPDTNAKHPDGNTIAAMFLRGDGKNSAGTPGLHQADQLQNITGGVNSTTSTLANTNEATGAFSAGAAISARPSAVSATGYPYTFDASRVARTGTETRPASETVIWCTVGAGKAVNPGSVDVVALATSVSTQSSQIQDIQSKQVFTKFYQSPNTAWTVGGLLEITHNLGQPKLVQVYAVLTVATPSSPVGTIVGIGSVWINTNYWGAMVVAETTTIVRVRMSSALGLLVSAGSAETLTPSNSQIFVRVAA